MTGFERIEAPQKACSCQTPVRRQAIPPQHLVAAHPGALLQLAALYLLPSFLQPPAATLAKVSSVGSRNFQAGSLVSSISAARCSASASSLQMISLRLRCRRSPSGP